MKQPTFFTFNFFYFPDMYLKIVKSQITALNIPINVAWIGHHLRKYVWKRTKEKLPVLFFSPEPSSLTANGNFTRVKFPSCQRDYNSLPHSCDFRSSQFSKMVWWEVEKEAPEILHIVKRMVFTRAEYEEMLQWFKLWDSDAINPVACTYLRVYKDKWSSWLPKHFSRRKSIYLGGLFPMTGLYWMQPGLVQGKHYYENRCKQREAPVCLCLKSDGGQM